MTEIDFYTNVSDKLHTACRIAAKAYSVGRRIVIFCADAESAQHVDRLLWSQPATGFVPHCRAVDALAPLTPVIVDHRGDNLPHDQVLLNLTPDWPPFFARFERLVEVVSSDDEDRKLARGRYKFYRDRGYEIRTHDLGQAA